MQIAQQGSMRFSPDNPHRCLSWTRTLTRLSVLAVVSMLVASCSQSAAPDDKTAAVAEKVARLRAAAEAGDASAQYRVGKLYAEGQIVRKNTAEAARWYENAGAAGCEHVPFQSYSMRMDGEIFSWCVFVDPCYRRMRDIVSIKYILHPTYENPVRIATNLDQCFALFMGAWGSFEVRMIVTFKDGHTSRQAFYLKLMESAWPNQSPASPCSKSEQQIMETLMMSPVSWSRVSDLCEDAGLDKSALLSALHQLERRNLVREQGFRWKGEQLWGATRRVGLAPRAR